MGDSIIRNNQIDWRVGGIKFTFGIVLKITSGETLGNNNITDNNINLYSYYASGINFENDGASDSNVIQDNIINSVSQRGWGIGVENDGDLSQTSVRYNVMNISAQTNGVGLRMLNPGGGNALSYLIEGNDACRVTGSSVVGFQCSDIISSEIIGSGNIGPGICGDAVIDSC